MSKNILCDGLASTVDSLLNDFQNNCRDAMKDFNNIRNKLPDFSNIDSGILNSVDDKLNELTNDINKGLSLGQLGNMAKCLGLTGMSFNASGLIGNMPNWSLNTLMDRIGCQIEYLAGLPLREFLNITNSLRSNFDFSGIDKLIDLLSCLQNNCNSYNYPSPPYVEEKLADVGLTTDGQLESESIYKGIMPPIGWEGPNEIIWDIEKTDKLGKVSNSYFTTTQTLYKAAGENPQLSLMAKKILNKNCSLCY